MMDAIYTFLMQLIHKRFHQKQHSEDLADVPLNLFNDRLKLSRRYQVFGSRNGLYQVQILDSSHKHVVNLPTNTCDCTNFREYSSPCTHAIAACKYATEDPFEHVDWIYTTETLKKTYSYFLKPISIENLTSNEAIQPPVAKQ